MNPQCQKDVAGVLSFATADAERLARSPDDSGGRPTTGLHLKK